MIEIPESIVLSVQLTDLLKGKLVKHVAVGTSPHRFTFYFNEPAKYPKLLEGKTVGVTNPVGGKVEIQAEDTRLMLSDGANIRYFKSEEQIPKKHQLHIQFEDLTSIVCTVQMYSMIWMYYEGENREDYYIQAKSKPSPLSDAFNIEYFEKLISDAPKKLSAKAFLATEQRIPGLGNGVLQDILFNSEINPKSKIQFFSDGQWNSLFESIKRTLADMAKEGGRDTEKDVFGKYGRYKTILSNKTFNTPCPKCGSVILRQAYLGGNVYFCPSCQPVIAS